MKTAFNRVQTLAATSALAVLMSGCANMTETQRAAAIGAGIGAVTGAVVDNDNRERNAAIGAGVGALGGYIWSKHMQDKKVAMEKATVGTGVAVSQTPDNRLKVNVPSDVSFATNSAAINPQLRPILDQFAAGLSAQPNMDVNIVGHTDSTGSIAVNQPLSINRASSVRDYLAMRGVNPARISIAGVADTQPVASNTTEVGRAQNRRVEIFLGERAVASR